MKDAYTNQDLLEGQTRMVDPSADGICHRGDRVMYRTSGCSGRNENGDYCSCTGRLVGIVSVGGKKRVVVHFDSDEATCSFDELVRVTSQLHDMVN